MSESQIIGNYITGKRSYDQGENIFQENEESGEVFVILQGRVRIKKDTVKGRVVAARLKTGDILGEVRLFDPATDRRSVTAVAEDDVVVGILDHYRLSTELYALDPRLKSLLRTLASRVRKTTAEAASLARVGKPNSNSQTLR